MTLEERKQLEALVRAAFEAWLKTKHWTTLRDLKAMIKAYEAVR
jgi:hypothetical protein